MIDFLRDLVTQTNKDILEEIFNFEDSQNFNTLESCISCGVYIEEALLEKGVCPECVEEDRAYDD